MMIIDTPEGIKAFRLLALRGALGLQIKGLNGKLNAYAIIKKEFGLKGSKAKVYELFEAKLREMKILVS